MKAYIISWFGDRNTILKNGKSLREYRKEVHEDQLDWLFTIRPNLKIVINAQDYDSGEERDDPRIEYIHNEPSFPSRARNVLLKKFYESGDKWGWFCDNDAKFYTSITDKNDYMQSEDLIDTLVKKPDTFQDIDFFTPINPANSPFRAEWEKPRYKDHFVFHWRAPFKGSMFFIKNTCSGLYFDERFKNDEDHDFCLNLMKNKKHVWVCKSLVLKEVADQQSTLFGEETNGGREARKKGVEETTSLILEKYGDDGIGSKPKGGWHRDTFYKLHWKKDKWSYVPRPNPIL